MKHALVLAAALLATAAAAGKDPPAPFVTGLKNPESVAVAPDGKFYVSVIGEFDKAGDGAIMRIEDGKAVPFATGLDDPKGLVAVGTQRGTILFVADRDKVLRIDSAGKVETIAGPDAFPTPPKFLNDLAFDIESAFAPTLYVSDSGDLTGAGGAVYRVTIPFQRPGSKPQKPTVTLVADAKTIPGLHTPNGVALDGRNHLLLVDSGTGILHRIRLSDKTSETVADGFGFADGVAWDHFGRLFVSDYTSGKVYVIPRAGMKPVLFASGFQTAADICVDGPRKRVLVPDMKAGTVTAIPIVIPGETVDESPLPLKTEVAFPDLKWNGWTPETETGKPNQLRPLLLTHAGDGSNRIFVGEEHGTVYVFPNDPKATTAKVFLDIRAKVQYDDRTNEEGLLGLAFHPRFKETGEFFVYYTPKGKSAKENVIARFRVRKDNPDEADPGSEEEVFRYTNRPFWNHAGGTIAFGPDGYLYAVHGDGGSANDPFDNGQNLNKYLGKIIRLDVDHKEDGKNYAVPKDNPFVGQKDTKPEIWAYGVRNPWRIAFDRKTGRLWAGDVGQNLYEEIDIIEKGKNYGWNRRESFHPFGDKGVGVKPAYVEPIWEYHHDVGKSITGGTVYRGPSLPELDGYYLYGDYVSTKIWALKYDDKLGRVVENRSIADPGKPIYSFGEDEKGEVYFLTATTSGKGAIYKFAK
jgi:glucose/arabinose dehydrogenase